MDGEVERTAQGSSRVRRSGILGALLLLIGYALPLRGPGHGFWQSLLLGPVGGGFHVPFQYRIFTPLMPIGVLAMLLYASIASGDRSMDLLGAGVMIGAAVVEGLFFVGLLGEGLVGNLAIWIGLVGSVVVLITGISAWRDRKLQA